MIKKLKNLKPEEIRLLLAVSLCLIFLATTPTTTTEGCSCLEIGYGFLSVENHSAWNRLRVTFNGPMVFPIEFTGQLSGNRPANSGLYIWAACATNDEEPPYENWILIQTGQVTVCQNELATIVID